tara:strand:+ start:338 stop:586 length:249 start_codon:yes stop_codon:yes gene_type:complete
MALKYVIKDFRDEGDKKYVGFTVTDEKGSVFVIDKKVSLSEGKTDEQYVKDALALAKSEIDAWVASFAQIGKTWNPDAEALE